MASNNFCACCGDYEAHQNNAAAESDDDL